MANLFQLDGLDLAMVMLSASAPAGFNAMTIASIEKLEQEFAASLVASALFFIRIFLTVL